jgi:hypothetical protein
MEMKKSTVWERNEGHQGLYDSRENNETHDCIGAGVCRPFVECIDTVITRNVLLDELIVNRLGVYPVAEPRGGNRLESNVFGCPY